MQSTMPLLNRPMPLARFPLPDFEAANSGLIQRVEVMLDRYCAEAGLHARLLNTLSLLEHIGSRKIMATQSGRSLDQPTLRHLAEETRHAFFFKRLAEKIAQHGLDYSAEALAAPLSAQMYFQRLDASTAKSLGGNTHPKAPYLYMSLIVELRAVWIYRIYQATLARSRVTISLRSILIEEEGHLDEMCDAISAIGLFEPALVQKLCEVEQMLFQRLLRGLERELENSLHVA